MFKTFEKDGLELVIDDQTGEVFATRNGLAKLSNKNPGSIDHFKGGKKWALKETEVLTPGGLQGGKLFDESQILETLIKFRPELVMKFAALGMRLSLHNLVGYHQPEQQHQAVQAVSREVLQREHDRQHNAFQLSTAQLKVQPNTLAKLCVAAVTGKDYREVMSGVAYKEAWSPDVLTDEQLADLTKVKGQMPNYKLRKVAEKMSGFERALYYVKVACKDVGVTCRLA